jgi:hypothetical protein
LRRTKIRSRAAQSLTLLEVIEPFEYSSFAGSLEHGLWKFGDKIAAPWRPT